MIKLYRKFSEDSSKSVFCDSDEFPNDVFTRYKCNIDFKEGTVTVYGSIYQPNGGLTYYLPFENMDKSWLDKGGYRIETFYYRDANPSNPSGNKENLWMQLYVKDFFNKDIKVTKILGVIKYEYDQDDNLTTYYRVQPYSANQAYTQAVNKQTTFSAYKLYTKSLSTNS